MFHDFNVTLIRSLKFASVTSIFVTLTFNSLSKMKNKLSNINFLSNFTFEGFIQALIRYFENLLRTYSLNKCLYFSWKIEKKMSGKKWNAALIFFSNLK